jgi:hypothetical protein
MAIVALLSNKPKAKNNTSAHIANLLICLEKGLFEAWQRTKLLSRAKKI